MYSVLPEEDGCNCNLLPASSGNMIQVQVCNYTHTRFSCAQHCVKYWLSCGYGSSHCKRTFLWICM